ncbi:PD-(D/E)XK nuclease family protein [Candidatus Riflebacteria bacterium]
MGDTKNIFDIIQNVTRRIEPFHSETLGWMLKTDLHFADEFINKFIPKDFLDVTSISQLKSSGEYYVKTEHSMNDRSRIDLTMRLKDVLIVIEVKTDDKSTTENQLNHYFEQLKQHDEYKDLRLFFLYLTPFNNKNCPEEFDTNRLHAVKEFKRFDEAHPGIGRHINWEDVVDIYPEGSNNLHLKGIYFSHKIFVQEDICNKKKFDTIRKLDRSLSEFVGEDIVKQFFDQIESRDIVLEEDENKFFISLEKNSDKLDYVLEVVNILLKREEAYTKTEKINEADESVLRAFEEGSFHSLFKPLFENIIDTRHAWLRGSGDLGLCVYHSQHPKGVSVCTIKKDSIEIRKKR